MKIYEQKIKGIKRYYPMPEWITDKMLEDIKREAEENKEFRETLILIFISDHRNEHSAQQLGKFIDSYIYKLNVND